MEHYHGKSPQKINEIMKAYIPETAGCNYADFPMNHPRWLKPNEKTPKGEPCFIKTDNKLPDTGIKTGYIWGPGPFSFGFYHLLTKTSHGLVYNRILNNKVLTGAEEGMCDCCFGVSNPASKLPSVKADDRDDMKRLFHARSVASKPNDGVAARDQLNDSKLNAQQHYMYDSNIQVGTAIATYATSMSR